MRIFVLATLLFVSGLWGNNGVFELLKPSGKTLFEEASASFIMRIGRGIDRVEIMDRNGTTYTVTPKRTRPIYCQAVPLQLGLNKITVTTYQKGKALETISRELYHSSQVFKAYKYPPLVFKAEAFHTETNEKRCQSCHDMTLNEKPGIAFENVRDSNCYGCHKGMVKRKFAHAPAVNWLCTSCHKAEDSLKTVSKYPTPKRVKAECFSCHKKRQTEWEGRRFWHDPVETGRCDKCHNPHAGEEENFLRKPVWELCVSCHKSKMSENHVITVFSGKPHPTKGKPDPSRPGEELSCVSCHNPHASDSRSLLMLGGKSIMALCARCHKK